MNKLMSPVFRRAAIFSLVLATGAVVFPSAASGGACHLPAVPGRTVRVSVAHDGAQANGPSYFAEISANGRYVAFASSATNLARGGSDGVYVHDRTSRR
jgi:hypothetical protein